MTESIPAVYEDGKFKPLQKINLPEHKHVHLILIPDEEAALLNSQKKELSRITGIGKGDKTDVARKHDQYLY
jgi:predicted DNA-binding antitoxin AbrB/MazE fold protein